MSTVGIITEFNPFHNGHEYAISKAKEITGADTAIIAMSGDFVQRGEPAICNKFTRTQMALACNADIVLELPVCFCISSAQRFAEGGVALLSMTGVVDYLCFGSESGDIEEIKSVANVIDKLNESSDFQKRIHDLLQTGMSYPAARAKIISEESGISADFLSSPNNILAVEYCLALNKYKRMGMKVPEPMTFARIGDGYHANVTEDSKYTSATAIRELLLRNYIHTNNTVTIRTTENTKLTKNDLTGNIDVASTLSNYVPLNALSILLQAFHCTTSKDTSFVPIASDDFSSLLFMKLNTTPVEVLEKVPNINHDLLNSIIKNTREPFLISELIAKIKTKAFTHSAISRALFSLLLLDHGFDLPEYIRLLGFKKNSSGIIKNIRDNSVLPVITKLADVRFDSKMLATDIYAANLYEQVTLQKRKSGFTDEYRTGVIIYEM